VSARPSGHRPSRSPGYQPTGAAGARGPLTLELDLIGRKITLSERDADLLLAGAEAGSGSSIGSRDLATRLNDVTRQSPQLRRGLILSRPETRALQRVIETQFEAGDRLLDLREALTELLGPSAIPNLPADGER